MKNEYEVGSMTNLCSIDKIHKCDMTQAMFCDMVNQLSDNDLIHLGRHFDNLADTFLDDRDNGLNHIDMLRATQTHLRSVAVFCRALSVIDKTTMEG